MIADLRSAADLAADKPHGTRIKYMGGCRCLRCRMANTNYETKRSAARRRGEWNGLVDTAPARAHLRQLSRKGVGYKTAADAASISRSVVAKIVNGERRRMRAQAMARLLKVTPAARADHSIVPAARTWLLLGQLLEEGFTKAAIARELLGPQAKALQIRRDFVLARTQLAVEKLWRKYMAIP